MMGFAMAMLKRPGRVQLERRIPQSRRIVGAMRIASNRLAAVNVPLLVPH